MGFVCLVQQKSIFFLGIFKSINTCMKKVHKNNLALVITYNLAIVITYNLALVITYNMT